jgi:importin subunit beta-1
MFTLTVIVSWPLMYDSDLAEAFPNGEIQQYFRHDFLTVMTRETRANQEFSNRTRETARWAREQIKRQVGMLPANGTLLSSNPTISSFHLQPQYPQHILYH